MIQTCIKNIALAKGDVTLCDRLSNVHYREVCYDELGNQLGDEKICEMVSLGNYVRDSCISNVAISKKDYALCDKISDTNIKSYCLKDSTFLKTGIRSRNLVIFYLVIFFLVLSSMIILIKKSGLRNKGIWIGLTAGVMVGLGMGLKKALPSIISRGAGLEIIGYLSFIELARYGIIGLLSSLLICKVRNPIKFGLIAGFLLPLIFNTIAGLFPLSGVASFIQLACLWPIYLILSFFMGSPSGEGGLAYYFLALYLSPLFYAVIGLVVGWLINMKRRNSKIQ